MRDVPQELIRQAQSGDIRAFERIYRHYSPGVYRLAFRMMGNETDAQDVTQEVFITLFGKIKGFRFESALRTWIYRVTVNLSLNIRKKRSKIQDPLMPFNEEFARGPAASGTETLIEREHSSWFIESVLQRLPPEQKICLVLRGVEGLSYRQIAEILQININTVRTRIRRARQTFLAMKDEVLADEV